MSKRSPLLPIFLIVLVDVFGLTLVIPLLGLYAERFHASPFQATLLVSTYAACMLVSGPLLGKASDSVGRKPMLLISQIGTFVGFLVLANAKVLWVLYLARAIDGATAGNLSLAQAYISDNTAPKDRSKSFAVVGIAFGLGFFIGPALTGYLVRYGMTAPIYLAAGMSATSVLCTATLLPGGPPPANSVAADDDAGPGGKRLSLLSWSTYLPYFKRPILRGLLFQFFCYVFAFSTFTSGFALFAERRFTWSGHPFTVKEIGYVFAYVGFLGIILQGGLIGRLVKRFGEPALVASGFATIAVAYFALGIVDKVGALLAVATLSSYGNGVARPALTSLITQAAGPREQGVVLGLNQSLNAVAQVIAPMIAGVMLDRGHLFGWALVAAIAAVGGFLGARIGSSLVPSIHRTAENAG